MLRSVTLPALFVLAVYFFWRGLEQEAQGKWKQSDIKRLHQDQPQRTQRAQRQKREGSVFSVTSVVQNLAYILKSNPIFYFLTAGLC